VGASAAIIAATLLVAGAQKATAATETKTAKKVDINKATAAQLEDLPGIGPALAKKIVAGRPYKTVNDLSKAGISATELRKIDSLVTVGSASDSAPAKEEKPLTKTSKPSLVDLNKASAAQLEALPGIGPALAKKIIAGRPYKTVNDLSKAGISANEIRKIDSLVTVGSTTDSAIAKEEKPLSRTVKPSLVDLNKASTAQLEALPGIGPALARKITAGRPYKTVDDLSKAGVSAAEVTRIKSLVTVDGAKQSYTVAKPIIGDTNTRAVDVNTSKETTLEAVPGIGSAYAKKIIAGRPYKSVDDLVKAGIPQSTVDKIRTLVAVGRPFEAPPEKGMVWVNLDSKRYHKETSAWYGRTKNGKYMSEADAIKAGYQLAGTRQKKS
jgi:DNA uptake protein ComE-like DNA-binding protein